MFHVLRLDTRCSNYNLHFRKYLNVHSRGFILRLCVVSACPTVANRERDKASDDQQATSKSNPTERRVQEECVDQKARGNSAHDRDPHEERWSEKYAEIEQVVERECRQGVDDQQANVEQTKLVRAECLDAEVVQQQDAGPEQHQVPKSNHREEQIDRRQAQVVQQLLVQHHVQRCCNGRNQHEHVAEQRICATFAVISLIVCQSDQNSTANAALKSGEGN